MKAAYIQAVNFKGGIVRLVRDTKEIAPSGWFGPFDPKDSSAELGQEALDLAVSYIRDFSGRNEADRTVFLIYI